MTHNFYYPLAQSVNLNKKLDYEESQKNQMIV